MEIKNKQKRIFFFNIGRQMGLYPRINKEICTFFVSGQFTFFLSVLLFFFVFFWVFFFCYIYKCKVCTKSVFFFLSRKKMIQVFKKLLLCTKIDSVSALFICIYRSVACQLASFYTQPISLQILFVF